MKKPTGRLLLTVLLLLSAVSLSACSDADWDLLAALAEDWAADNGVWDGENLNMGNLARLGVEEQIDEIFNGPPSALDAGSVTDDIRKADELARQGSTQRGALGLENIDKAIAMRPNDWSYWEQKGAMLLAEGRPQEAQAAFSQSNALVREHVVSGGGDCKTYARNMLTQREQALMAQINLDYRSGKQPPAGLVDRLDSVRAELGLLDTSAGSCG
jgi:hypothetical protein